MWPGIAPEAQKAVVDHITANHFLDWGFDVFKLEVRGRYRSIEPAASG